MNSNQIIRATEDFVNNHIIKHDSAHDWWHIDRVRRLALFICGKENSGDSLIVEVSALLHEIGDRKFDRSSGVKTAGRIRSFLHKIGFNEPEIESILFINRNISFSKGYRGNKVSEEFRIVQDADRLDAIGAIGIARAFSYGGFSRIPLFDPEGLKDSTVKHFYDKLLKLKDLMNTETARKIAEERHKYMEEFLNRFFSEWRIE